MFIELFKKLKKSASIMTCGDLSLIARDEIATGVPSISHNQVLTHPWRTTQGHWLRLSIICWSIAFAAANMCRSCLPSTAEAGQSRAQISHDQLWSHSLDVHWTASHTELLWLVCVYRGSINYTKSHVTFHSESSLNCCVLLILGYQVGFWSCTRHFYLICTQIISHDDVTDNCMNLSAVYTRWLETVHSMADVSRNFFVCIPHARLLQQLNFEESW